MEETRNSLAIILRNVSFRECDSRLDVYAKDFGRLSLVARGTKHLKSKMRGHIEPFTLVRIMIIKGKSWDYLGAVVTENAFLKIREDYDKTLLAGRAIKLFLDYIKEDELQDNLFNLLFLFLDFLNKNIIKDHELILTFFVLKFLSINGFEPQLQSYLDTGKSIKEKKHCFDFKAGGLVEEKKSEYCLKISVEAIKVLRLAIKRHFTELTKLSINDVLSKEITKIINSFFDYNMRY